MKNLIAIAAVAACLGAACGSSDAPNPLEGDGPVFAVMYEVYDDVGSNSYLAFVNSLDVASIDPGASREFAGGRAFLRVYNGWIFVGDAATPKVTRFSIADGELVEDGTISFANYGLKAGSIDKWQQSFISPTKAYLFDMASAKHIIWDPTTMTITGVIEPPAEFTREGLVVETSPPAVRGNRLYRAIFWANYDTAEYSQDQLFAVYDLDTDKLIETVAGTRCPNPGNLVHADEAGNFYFSNWIWPIAGTLMKGRAENCVLRIGVGSDRFDADWSLDYQELSGGKQGAMFSYLANGRGLVSIFDDSQVTFDETTDPWKYAGSPYWSIWSVDIAARTAAPIDGLPLSAGAYTPLQFADRSFVMLPKSDWSETRLYEITGNSATPGMIVPGWSYMIEKAR
jgi:hypothetical protein